MEDITGDTTTLSYLRPIIERMMNTMDKSEITITFKQNYRDQWDNNDISAMIKRYFRFLPSKDITEVLLVPEYGNNHNLHYHGLIRGKAKEKSDLKSWMNKRFGRSTITMVRHEERYVEYLLKEQKDSLINDIVYYDYTVEPYKWET